MHLYNDLEILNFVYTADAIDAICLDLLVKLLYPQGIGKGAVFLKIIEVRY